MTTMHSRSTIVTPRDARHDADALAAHMTLRATWPCLARAFDRDAKGNAESELRLALELDCSGVPASGSLRITVVAQTGPRAGLAQSLCEARMHGTVTRCDDWLIIEVRADDGSFIDALVHRSSAESSSELMREPSTALAIPLEDAVHHPGYITTDFLRRVGLDGGRYGAPRIGFELR